MRIRRVTVLVVIVLFISSAANTLAEVNVESPDVPIVIDNGLDQDAAQYAIEYGVSFQEAKHRLEVQALAGQLTAALETDEADTFGGAWIQHEPEYKIVVQFTREGDKTIWPYVEDGPLESLIEVRTTDVTLAELISIQEKLIETVRPLDIPFESGINLQDQQVEIYVVEREQFDQAVVGGEVQISDHVAVVTVDRLSTQQADIYGGLAAGSCTLGFSVKNSSGTRGVTTAGHCGNSATYNGVSLPFQSEWYGSAYDVQWHTVPGFTLRSWMKVSTSGTYRNVSGIKSRTDQVVGDYVCKFGKTTGYNCGNIVDKNYQTQIPNSTATFIKVHNSSGADLIEPGDSGGPWFNGNTAYGDNATGR